MDVDDDTLYLIASKIKGGLDAAHAQKGLEHCPYIDEADVKAWRFGWKLGLYSKTCFDHEREKRLQPNTRRAKRAARVGVLYNEALAILQDEIPAELDIKL